MATNDSVKAPTKGILFNERESVELSYDILQRLEDRNLIEQCAMCSAPHRYPDHEAGAYHPLVSWDILGEVLSSDPNLGILARGRLKIWVSMEFIPDDSDETFDVNSEPVDILSTDDLAEAVIRWNELAGNTCIRDRLTLEEVRESIYEGTNGLYER